MKNVWVPLSGALAQQQYIDTIANNVANANSPGFKKDQLTFKEYLTVHEKPHETIDLPDKEWKPEDFYRSYGVENGYVKVDGQYTVFRQGPLNPTGNVLDLALRGKGFLEVWTPNGPRYTRKGDLALSAKGELVTAQGYPILSPAPAPTPPKEGEEASKPNIEDRFIRLPNGSITVTMQGQILVDGKEVGQLSLVEFKDPHHLRKEGNSFFINSEEGNRITSNLQTTVHQGFLEDSNVNAMQEMSNLIQAHRHFESLQKAIKTYDTIAGKSVNEIAKF